jgi:hypothetical protein
LLQAEVIIVATLLLLCGLFPNFIMKFADASRLSYPSAVLFIALAAVYAYCFSVSVALTQKHRSILRLTQEVALLECRLRQLEVAGARDRAGSDSEPRDPPVG